MKWRLTMDAIGGISANVKRCYNFCEKEVHLCQTEASVIAFHHKEVRRCEIDAIGGILVKGLERYVPPCNKAKHKPVRCHFSCGTG